MAPSQRAHSLLETSQNRLEALYRLPQAPSPLAFLTTLPAHQGTPGGQQSEEQLLIHQPEQGDELAVGLYLSAELLARLNQQDQAALGDIAAAIEGVSHLRYLIYKASNDHRVTGLELELQAEVDKFLLLASSHHSLPGLRRQLFHKPRLHKGMSSKLQERYRESNRLAARYCRYLERRYFGCNSLEALRHELGRFYRMDHHGKIRHVNLALPH